MEYIYVGKIVNTHGIKGELRIKSDFDKKEIVFKSGFTLYVGDSYIPFEIVGYRRHKEFDMVTFKGFDNINQVLQYLKMNVYVKREDLNLDKKDYLLQDLIGLNVFENGEKLGEVIDIVYNGSNILLYIEAEKKFYIPNNESFIKEVDLIKKEIKVMNAKGLIL